MIIFRLNSFIFLVFAQNIDHLTEAVLMSTHNLCFRAKLRKVMVDSFTKV